MPESDFRTDIMPNDTNVVQQLGLAASDSIDGPTKPSTDITEIVNATSLFRSLEDTGSVQDLIDTFGCPPSSLTTSTNASFASSSPYDSTNLIRKVPHSRRVGFARPPSNYKRPPSLNDLSSSSPNSVPYSTSLQSSRSSLDITPTSGSDSPNPGTSPPAPPPRSPLRPPPRSSTSDSPKPTQPRQLEEEEPPDKPSEQDLLNSSSALAKVMPLLRSHSFGSLSALLESLDPDAQAKHTSRRSKTPEKALPTPPDDNVPPLPFALASPGSQPTVSTVTDDAVSIASSLSLAIAPTMTKRTHALLELLTSERAYASDLALIRDIHIPLALGQPAPFSVATPVTPPTSSGSSSRTMSTASDSSTSSSQIGPAMTRDDTKIVFSNVAELAMFSDTFVERLEDALGSVLEGGLGYDCVGELFLEIIPALEPPYKTYITRHPTALAHLNALPSSPALTSYLERTRTLASSLTHAWDLPSLLIKPVQRLLKYPLLLAAIIAETPDAHPDKENLRLARTRMEDVARSVNEGRRRWEIVKEVLSAKVGEVPKKKGVGVGVTASVNLSRMKSLRGVKLKENNEEAEHVAAMEAELKRYSTFVKQFAKEVVDWRATVHVLIMRLREWAVSFGKVIGLSETQKSEAFDAFMTVVSDELLALSNTLETDIKNRLLLDLASLKDSMQAPFRLIDAMNTLEPLHYGLANLNFSKNRPPPALLEASQSYLALRGQLRTELPDYLTLLDKGMAMCVLELSRLQSRFWADVRDRWGDLWDALRVEGERNAGADETLRVWWERWADAERRILDMNIINPKKVYVERPSRRRTSAAVVTTTLSALDPSHALSPTSTSSKHRSQGSVDFGGSHRRSGSSAAGTGLSQRRSNESLRSGKSGKSKTSRHSRPEEPQPQYEYYPHPPRPTPTSVPQPSPTHVPKPSRTKSVPMVPPVRTSTTSSSHVLSGEVSLPPSPLPYIDLDDDRGRTPARRPSLKKKITESLRPSSSHSRHRRRSSSVKSLGAPSLIAPSYHTTDTAPLPPYQAAASMARRAELQETRALYLCRAVHPCSPPDGVSYRNLPFFTLQVGNVYSVLREYGHPSTHEDLPLYVDDGEDCLLLVRDQSEDVGWALASFLIPLD